MISVIIPAHNECTTISRTLETLINGSEPGDLDIVVVCNGCTDATAYCARRFGFPVRVVETQFANKTHALNLGDKCARAFPRIYVDADVLITFDAVRQLAERLHDGRVLAAAPTAMMDVNGCSWPVRAYYSIRSLLPSAKEGIGGSGVYALSEAGRRRFDEFPAVVADDGFVRIQFRAEERETLSAVCSIVFPARTLPALIATKTRSHYGSFELEELFPELWKNRGDSNNKSIRQLFKRPGLWPKLTAYCLITVVVRQNARARLRRRRLVWDRDATSRAMA